MNDHSPKTSKKQFLPEGIYIEAKPAAKTLGEISGDYHAYLVYRDGKGNAEVIRGGPDSWDFGALGGDIEVESGKPLTESADAYDEEDSPQSRFAKRLDLGGRSPQKVWEDMKITAQTIGKNETDYNLFSQNSNSTIATVLNRSGLNDRQVSQICQV